jgi:hypothetical protein
MYSSCHLGVEVFHNIKNELSLPFRWDKKKHNDIMALMAWDVEQRRVCMWRRGGGE